jgi:adenylosuccinate synthase
MENRMRTVMAALAITTVCACSDKNSIAEKVEQRADNRAEAMEAAADSMENALQQNIVDQQAETVRQAGEERAEAIRDSQLDAEDLSPEQRNALIEGDLGTVAPARR